MTLHGQRVVFAGGTSGIGLASAQAAAAEGAAVVVLSRNQERVEAALRRLPDGAEGRVLDVTDDAAVDGFFRQAGPFDHLVFTAGEPLVTGKLADLDLEQARRFFQTRYFGTLAVVKHAAPHIRPGGSVVLSSGSAAARPQPGWATAASICGAIEALTRALALELAPVRVNAVAPGVVKTPLWDPMPEPERQALYQQAGEAMPTGRVGAPDDIAEAHLYLMRSAFTTGTVLAVDGGAVLV